MTTSQSTLDTLRWDGVLRRDRSLDGTFVYAVTSTGVFCRPSCPSRRPRRDRVRFFETSTAAEHSGFRACRRCRPTSVAPPSIADAIVRASQYLTQHADESVPLSALATIAGISASHLQRQFKHALGVSPREYQAACRASRFRSELRSGRDVTAAMYEAGYGSPSRIYESPPTGRGMHPATYRRGGAGAQIHFTTVPSDLGRVLIAATDKGICAVKIGDSQAELEQDLRREFPKAQISKRAVMPAEWVRAVVDQLEGRDGIDLPLDIRGTAFQWKVWRALQEIPIGETRSYSDVARAIDEPTAVRAVAQACARNPVCVVVPCHRVIAKNGALGGYRWGAARKQQLLANEAVRRNGTPRRAVKSK